MKRENLVAVVFVAAIVLGFAGYAGAVDGTIEINQAKVTAAGGFPYFITSSGSYRLTGNLTVTSNVTGISIQASHVTIDLNGFSIFGPGSGIKNGIFSQLGEGNTVENGTVTGFNNGIVLGDDSIVKSVHADLNSNNGMTVGNDSVIEGCTATSNGNDGIFCSGSRCRISGNTVTSNLTDGIEVAGSDGLILHNSISGNFDGISAHDATTGYGENVLDNPDFNVSGATSMKNNVCSGVVC